MGTQESTCRYRTSVPAPPTLTYLQAGAACVVDVQPLHDHSADEGGKLDAMGGAVEETQILGGRAGVA